MSPNDPRDPLIEEEKRHEMDARKLAGETPWISGQVVENWPGSIAATYVLLRLKLEEGQIDAATLVLKDLAELLSRFSALTMGCEVLGLKLRDEKIREIQAEVRWTLFGKLPTMGDWASLANQLAAWMQTGDGAQGDWVTRPIAGLWRKGKKETRLARLLKDDLVNWRNETIGHGVRGYDVSPQLRKLQLFLGADSRESLNQALAEVQDQLGEIKLHGPCGLVLRGSGVMHSLADIRDHARQLGYRVPVELAGADERRLNLAGYLAVRRCGMCGRAETFHFESRGKGDASVPDFVASSYELGHRIYLSSREEPEFREAWEACREQVWTSEDAGRVEDEAVRTAVVQLLDEQSVERDYVPPRYLRDDLRTFVEECLEEQRGGMYWLQAPAHVGKSTFVQGLDPEYYRSLGDRGEKSFLSNRHLAIATFYVRREYRYHLAQFYEALYEKLRKTLGLTAGSRDLPRLDIERHTTPNDMVGFLAKFQQLERRPLMIIVDGLDELPERHPGILDILPQPRDLPRDVFLLLTSRPVVECSPWMRWRLDRYAAAPGMLIRWIGLEDQGYRELLEKYAHTRLGKQVDPALLRVFLEQSDRRFLYFRFLVERLKDGSLGEKDIGNLGRAQNLIPGYVESLRSRYAGTSMGDRIDRLLDMLALAEGAHVRINEKLPVLVQKEWKGLPMSVLYELVDGSRELTFEMAYALARVKPLLGTWRGEQAGDQHYRLGIKGLRDLLEQRSEEVLTSRLRLLVQNIWQGQREWLALPVTDRPLVWEYRGKGLDWALENLAGLADTADQAKELELEPEPEILLSLAREMRKRARGAAYGGEHHRAVRLCTTGEFLWVLLTGKDRPDMVFFAQGVPEIFSLWVGLSSTKAVALQYLGALVAAEEGFTRLVAIFEGVRDQMGTEFTPEMADNLASAYSNRGVTLRNQGRREEAIGDYGRAIAIREELQKRLGAEFTPKMADNLASAYTNRGNALGDQGRREEAIGDYGRAIAMWEELQKRLDTEFTPEMADNLASAYSNRGNALGDQGRREEAIGDYGQAIAIREELQKRLGAEFTPEMANNLASAYTNRGVILGGQGRREEAIGDYGRAIAIREELQKRLGAEFTPKMTDNLASAYTNRGNALGDQGRREEAIGDYGRAIAMWEELQKRLGTEFTPEMADGLARAYVFRGVFLYDSDPESSKTSLRQGREILCEIEAWFEGTLSESTKKLKGAFDRFLEDQNINLDT